MIKFDNVSYKYSNGNIGVENINIILPSTGIVIIKGKNGQGKSTFLKLLANVIKPDFGTIYYNNKNINTIKNYTSDYIGYISSQFDLFHELDVINNIKFIKNNKSNELINELQVEDLLKRKIYDISGGEARRISIIRTLNKSTPILLCDELTESLDDKIIKIIMSYLKKISKNMLIVIASHDTSILSYADQIIEFSNHMVSKHTILKESKNINSPNIDSNTIRNNKLLSLAWAHIKNYSSMAICSFLLITICLILTTITSSLINVDLNKIFAEKMLADGKNQLNIYPLDESYDINLSDEMISVYNYNIPINCNNFNDGEMFFLPSALIPNVAVLNDNYKFSKDKIVGSLPSNGNEVMISEYLFSLFQKYGVYNTNNELFYPTNYEDLLEVSLFYSNKAIKITGILLEDLDKYNILRNSTGSNAKLDLLYNVFLDDILENNYLYVLSDFDTDLVYDIKTLDSYLIKVEDKQELIDILDNYENSDVIELSYYIKSLKEPINKFLSILVKVSTIIDIIIIFILISVLITYFNHSINVFRNNHIALRYMGVPYLKISLVYFYELFIIYIPSFIINIISSNAILKEINDLVNNNIFENINILRINNYLNLQIFVTFLICILIIYMFKSFKIRNQIKTYL